MNKYIKRTLHRKRKELILAHLKLLFQYLPGQIEKDHGKYSVQQPPSLIIGSKTPKILSRNANLYCRL